jgi:hypothetical protein
MTNVSGTSKSAPPARPHAQSPNMPQIKPEDVRAMNGAFATARANMKLDGMPGRQQGKAMMAGLAATDARGRGAEAALGAAFDRQIAEHHAAERQADGQGLALAGQAAPPPPIMLAAMPSPQVDPSAFAQMLADLWTRENGKGAREVRVRFGADAWPATGALLVRNAAGHLDIAVQMARGADGGGRLDMLGEHLADAGLPVGALSIGEDMA